jgi:Planctomycete cytochrome C
MKFTPVNIWLLACSLLSPWLAGAQVSFNRDIRPIMSDTCFRCHGPDKSARMMDLRLDIRDQALKPLVDNKIPIVPGKPEQSEIIRRIFATDQSEIMPPEYAHKALTQAQKEIIGNGWRRAPNMKVIGVSNPSSARPFPSFRGIRRSSKTPLTRLFRPGWQNLPIGGNGRDGR